MDWDEDLVDDTVLALLQLTLHDGCRAWKGHDWTVVARLHAKGMIGNTRGKAKSVELTDEGLEASARLFDKLFGKPAAGQGAPKQG